MLYYLRPRYLGRKARITAEIKFGTELHGVARLCVHRHGSEHALAVVCHHGYRHAGYPVALVALVSVFQFIVFHQLITMIFVTGFPEAEPLAFCDANTK